MQGSALRKTVSLVASSLVAVLIPCAIIALPNGLASTIPNESLEPAAGKTTRRIRALPSSGRKLRPGLVAAITEPRPISPLLPIVEQANITQEHRVASDRVLRALPPHCRTHLQTFVVRYDGPSNRGLGGKSTIILDGSVPLNEFMGLLVHECAHVTHGNVLGNAESGKSTFSDGHDAFYNDSPMVAFFSISWTTENVAKRGTSLANFASEYGRSDAFEDFAETFVLYVFHRPILRERAAEDTAIAAKLAWMERHLPTGENALGTGTAVWTGTVPWDATKLAFVLNPVAQ